MLQRTYRESGEVTEAGEGSRQNGELSGTSGSILDPLGVRPSPRPSRRHIHPSNSIKCAYYYSSSIHMKTT